MPAPGFTRRKLVASLAASASAAMSQDQKPSADAELQLARERLKGASRVISRQDVPASAAPAFQFKP